MRWSERIFYFLCLIACFLPLFFMAFLLLATLKSGFLRISLDFLLALPSRIPAKAGLVTSMVGSFYLVGLILVIAVPLGTFSALYLEEYSKDSFLKRFIDINIANLAGVPSIIYGLLGLTIFVRGLKLGPSLISGALTLSLLVLPVIITAARESIRAVPLILKEAAFSLGSTKLMVTMKVVLPLASPAILTGTILAMARALGESAPLIVLGVATYVAFLPDSLLSPFSALPLQIYHWIERPELGFKDNSAGGIVILLFILCMFNFAVSYIRHKKERYKL